MDGAVFPQSLWRSEQEKSFGIQGVFGGELQTADSEPALTRNQQVPRVYKTVQSPNQKIPDRKTKCVIKTHINIKQNVIFGAKLKPV